MKKNDRYPLGQYLKVKRVEKYPYASMEVVDKKIGISHSTISRMEGGKGLPRPKTIKCLVEGLGIDKAELVEEIGKSRIWKLKKERASEIKDSLPVTDKPHEEELAEIESSSDAEATEEHKEIEEVNITMSKRGKALEVRKLQLTAALKEIEAELQEIQVPEVFRVYTLSGKAAIVTCDPETGSYGGYTYIMGSLSRSRAERAVVNLNEWLDAYLEARESKLHAEGEEPEEKECNCDHSISGSIIREYINKDGGSTFAHGHYDNEGCFETDGALPDLSLGRYDLMCDSDRCAVCKKQL